MFFSLFVCVFDVFCAVGNLMNKVEFRTFIATFCLILEGGCSLTLGRLERRSYEF